MGEEIIVVKRKIAVVAVKAICHERDFTLLRFYHLFKIILNF